MRIFLTLHKLQVKIILNLDFYRTKMQSNLQSNS
jgi:hypothetical protein